MVVERQYVPWSVTFPGPFWLDDAVVASCLDRHCTNHCQNSTCASHPSFPCSLQTWEWQTTRRIRVPAAAAAAALVGMMVDPAVLVVVVAAYVDDNVVAVVVAQFPGLDAAF
jgi:hypothetical protein